MTTKAAARSREVSYSIFAFFLMVANLGSLTSVGPVLAAIQSSLGLAGVAAGLVVALILLIFTGFSRPKL
jgi:cyanate permease